MKEKEVVQKENEIFDSKKIVTTLHSLMNEVTREKCTPDTVNAACNCSSQITQLLRLHLEYERLRGRFQK